MTPLLPGITDREEAVVLLIADGLSHTEIATRLGITRWTVKAHRDNARRKLEARTTEHLVAIVVRTRVAAT